jgi:predicted alpha/beta superfamily hydrolase
MVALLVLTFPSLHRAIAAEAAAGEVIITFKVKVPAGTPADAKLYLAGDAKALGEWKQDGVELKKGDDGIYSAKVSLPKDKQVEYKVTRGTWATVEKNADGSEMANRTLTPTKDAAVEIEVKAWADGAFPSRDKPPAEKKSTRSGDIRVHPKFHARALDNDRDILVYLPPGYKDQRDRRYPVLYMHDGQNVFDAATSFMGVEWGADETAGRLISDGTIEPLIIVAIANTPRRIDEYTLSRDAHRDAGGMGRQYMQFVVDEVKPFIDKTYRTKSGRDDTGVGGSSLGGTISLELCRAYPNVFGRCAAMSPALWWNDYELLKRFQKDAGWIKYCRFWIDVGSAEGKTQAERNAYLGGLLRLEAKLIFAGLKKGQGYEVLVVDGAQHNEAAWGARVDKVLTFLFPPTPASYNSPHGAPDSPPTPAPEPALPNNVAAGHPAPQ